MAAPGLVSVIPAEHLPPITLDHFHFVNGFLCCVKAFTFNYVLFVFAFALGNGLKNIAMIHVKECSAYVFLKEFYSIQSYI